MLKQNFLASLALPIKNKSRCLECKVKIHHLKTPLNNERERMKRCQVNLDTILCQVNLEPWLLLVAAANSLSASVFQASFFC